MLTTLKRLLRSKWHDNAAARSPQSPDIEALSATRAEDIERFLDAARRADEHGQSPWILRDEARLETLRRALEFTVHRGVWLQRDSDGIAHWQGRLLSLRHGSGPPLGMLLACRRDDEAAWQIRFFFIEAQWQGRSHGKRLLLAARRSLRGTPLRARLPVTCSAAMRSLQTAGFQRMHIDATEVASFEAPAEWH